MSNGTAVMTAVGCRHTEAHAAINRNASQNCAPVPDKLYLGDAQQQVAGARCRNLAFLGVAPSISLRSLVLDDVRMAIKELIYMVSVCACSTTCWDLDRDWCSLGA